jgi:hypothetical protein
MDNVDGFASIIGGFEVHMCKIPMFIVCWTPYASGCLHYELGTSRWTRFLWIFIFAILIALIHLSWDCIDM